MNLFSRKPKSPLRVAIVGTGGMAHTHAKHFKGIPACDVVAGVDLDPIRLKAFRDSYEIPRGFSSVDALLAWGKFDAVSIVTPDAFHAPLSIQCLRHKKHVLCEKPLALTHLDAVRMWVEARKAGVVHLVNLSYRNWPALEGVAQAIREGQIGELRHVEASYLQAWLPSKIWGDWRTSATWLWRLSSKHGSKGMGSLFVYPLTWLAGKDNWGFALTLVSLMNLAAALLAIFVLKPMRHRMQSQIQSEVTKAQTKDAVAQVPA